MPLDVLPLQAPRAFRLVGELDLGTAPGLPERLGLDAGNIEGDLTLDVSGLSFVDSAGVRALFQVVDALDGRGAVVLVSPLPQVRRVLDLMGVTGGDGGLILREAGGKEDETDTRSFPAHAAALSDIRRFIRARSAHGSFARWADGITLAVNEAAANAILHSGTGDVTVVWHQSPDRVEVEVRDHGVFRRAVSNESANRASRGILLMMSLMDQITISCGTDAHPGTAVRMVKFVNGRSGG